MFTLHLVLYCSMDAVLFGWQIFAERGKSLFGKWLLLLMGFFRFYLKFWQHCFDFVWQPEIHYCWKTRLWHKFILLAGRRVEMVSKTWFLNKFLTDSSILYLDASLIPFLGGRFTLRYSHNMKQYCGPAFNGNSCTLKCCSVQIKHNPTTVVYYKKKPPLFI